MRADGRRLSRRINLCLFGFGVYSVAVLFFLAHYLFLGGRQFLQAFIEKCLAQCAEPMTLSFSAREGIGLALVLFLFVSFWVALAKSLSEVWGIRKFTRSLVKTEISRRFGRILNECGLRADRVFVFPSRLSFACTAGLFSPKIYLSLPLIDSLSDEELKAVLRHEERHLQAKDPLRGMVVGFLARFFFFVPVAARLLRALKRDAELAADDHALALAHSPLVLASALVKVKRDSLARGAVGAGLTGGDILEERLSRILDPQVENEVRGRRRPEGRILAGFVLASALIVPLLPTESSFPKAAPWHCRHTSHEVCCPSAGAGPAHAHCRP